MGTTTSPSKSKKQSNAPPVVIEFQDAHLRTLDTTIPDKKWVAEVTQNIPNSRNAFAVIKTVCAKARLDPGYVLFLVYQYCKSAEEYSVLQRRERAGFAMRQAQQALLACEQLWSAIKKNDCTSLANSPRINLKASLDRFAGVLRWQIETNKQLATRKASGPDDSWLYLLAAEVRTNTDSPHLGEIATLVHWGLIALDSANAMIPSRRHFVARLKRFQKRFPQVADSLSSLVFP